MNIQPSDLYMAYFRGWAAGSGIKVIDKKFSEHESEDMQSEYNNGWIDGRTANKKAMLKVSQRLGYKPSILRTA